MADIIFYWDSQNNKRVSATGSAMNDLPKIPYQQVFTAEFQIGTWSNGTKTATNLTTCNTFAFAGDRDFSSATEPCLRTLNANIDSSAKATGIIDVLVDANTSTLQAALASSESVIGWIELCGFNSTPAEKFYLRFPVKFINKLDASGGTPPNPVGNYYTKSEGDAITSGKMNLVTSPTNGHVITTDGSGQGVDSGITSASLMTGNASITGATKTKITYDTKGLITSGADATTADIADSTNKRYVTDAHLIVIGNTSGTNTGDQTLPVKASGAEITTGTDDAKFATPKALADAGVTRQGNTFNGVSQLVKLDGSGKLPAIDGSALTGLSSAPVSSVFGKTGAVANISDSAGYLYNNGSGTFTYANPSGSGDVVGPATNSANFIPQWSGVNSKTLSNGLAVGTSANNLIQLDGSSKLPAVDGSQLTGISSGGITWAVITGTSNTGTANHGYIFNGSGGAVTMTLPSPTLGLAVYFLVRNKDNTCTIARYGSESIDGNAGNLVLDTLRGANGLVSDGTDWFLTYK